MYAVDNEDYLTMPPHILHNVGLEFYIIFRLKC